MSLAKERCTPVSSAQQPMKQSDAGTLAEEIPQWTIKDTAIEREWRFKGFQEAIVFVNKAAEIAIDQDHHPDILISYNRVRLTFSTHKIGGLSRNDFISAARIDLLDS